MRIALKVAYIGTDYHGFQVQPGVRTVEGELFKVFGELGLTGDLHKANLMASDRTDRSVHAISQVIAFDTDNPDAVQPMVINGKLPPSIWVWAGAHVPPDFDPRRDALTREYKYMMCGKYNISLLRNASKVLKGEHDFSNFATPEKDITNVCKVDRIEMRVEREFTIMDIKADHFPWHMVRKIATAMKMIGHGTREISWLEQMLNPEEFTEGMEPAPAYGLILKNVDYGNVVWKEDVYTKKIISENLEELFFWHGIMAEMIKELKESMTL